MKYKSSETVVDSDDELDTQFDIPPGFQALSKSATAKSSKGQIWLIQVPGSLPLEKLHELNDKEFTVDDKQFIMEDSNEELEKDRLKIIMNGKIAKTKISRSLKIKQTAHIPSININEVALPKPIVPQKENLIMRYQPTGYGDDEKNEQDAIIDNSKKSRKNEQDTIIDNSKKSKKTEHKTNDSHGESKKEKHKSKKRSKEDGDDKKHKKKKKRSTENDN